MLDELGNHGIPRVFSPICPDVEVAVLVRDSAIHQTSALRDVERSIAEDGDVSWKEVPSREWIAMALSSEKAMSRVEPAR